MTMRVKQPITLYTTLNEAEAVYITWMLDRLHPKLLPHTKRLGNNKSTYAVVVSGQWPGSLGWTTTKFSLEMQSAIEGLASYYRHTSGCLREPGAGQ